MPENFEKKNFIFLLKSVCSGTGIFFKIKDFSIIKSLFHMSLLSFICSGVFVVVLMYNHKDEAINSGDLLQKNFGNIIIKNSRIYPEKNPDVARRVECGRATIDYFPSLKMAKESKKLSNRPDSRFGFIWTPENITGWVQVNNSQYLLYNAVQNNRLPVDKSLTSIWSKLSKSQFEVKDEVKPFILQKSGDKQLLGSNFTLIALIPYRQIFPTFLVLFSHLNSVNSFVDVTKSLFYNSFVWIYFCFIFKIIFNVLFFSFFFSLIFTFLGRSGISNMKFRSYFTVAIYASFPAIIIATLFTATEISWIRYQTVFLIAFLVYLMNITRKLQIREEKGQKPKLQ